MTLSLFCGVVRGLVWCTMAPARYHRWNRGVPAFFEKERAMRRWVGYLTRS